MEKTIGDLDTKNGTVPVTFTVGEIAYSRDVNACFGSDGEYDHAATEERVEQVARGVAQKIALRVITKESATPPQIETPAPAEAEPEAETQAK